MTKIITTEEIEENAVASLPTRPTESVSFGGRGYTSAEMKAAFDRLPRLVAERLNSLLLDIDEGEIIDDAHFLKIREEMLFDNARRAAFSILSCGENNKKALVTKLQARGYSYELCKNVAIYMEHRGYIDEKKQIKLLCQNYLKKKYGKLKIINELVSHGYQREDVQEFVKKNLDKVDFADNCAYIIENKFMPISGNADDVKKMMGTLLRYGYNIGEIKEGIKIAIDRSKCENE